MPVFKKEDDIYSRKKNESLEDEDNPETERTGKRNSIPGGDLDIPGAELDNDGEDIGEEDEENNYYSPGGDNHDHLENDQWD